MDCHRYLEIWNGLIIQWGQVAKGSDQGAGTAWKDTITNLHPFSNSDFIVIGTVKAGSATADPGGVEIWVRPKTQTSFEFSVYNRNGGSKSYMPIFSYIAIGF